MLLAYLFFGSLAMMAISIVYVHFWNQDPTVIYASKGMPHLREKAHHIYLQLKKLPQQYNNILVAFGQLKIDLYSIPSTAEPAAIKLEYEIEQQLNHLSKEVNSHLTQSVEKEDILLLNVNNIEAVIEQRKELGYTKLPDTAVMPELAMA